MALKGVKPEKKEKRLKMFVYGPAGIGKTTAAIQFPNSYVVDTEKGTDFYSETINKSSSAVFQSANPDDIYAEIRELLTTKHQYKTLIIDPITHVYNATQEKWTRIFEKNSKTSKDSDIQDFGMRYWSKIKGEFKGLERLILALDMNVICTAHQKDVYGSNFSKLGVTFDSMRGDDYLFDLIFRIEKRGTDRIAICEKERADMGKQKFPAEFIWSYENFCKYYGREIIEKESVPVVLASPEQVDTIQKLISALNVDEATITKWFVKADVEKFSEMNGDTIQKCIDVLNKKIDELKNTDSKKEVK
jgi:GTPase SAR1 family protein